MVVRCAAAEYARCCRRCGRLVILPDTPVDEAAKVHILGRPPTGHAAVLAAYERTTGVNEAAPLARRSCHMTQQATASWEVYIKWFPDEVIGLYCAGVGWP